MRDTVYFTLPLMRKKVIKSLIAIKQSEILFDVIERDVELPFAYYHLFNMEDLCSIKAL